MNYPLHLGVTEAGDGEDGRTKSAVGIGALLEDGLGDTVRVSLTEEPELELPVAAALVAPYAHRPQAPNNIPALQPALPLPYSPFDYAKRRSFGVLNLGAEQVPRVVVRVAGGLQQPDALAPYGWHYDAPTDKWHIAEQAADFLWIEHESQLPGFDLPQGLQVVWAGKPDEAPTGTIASYPIEATLPQSPCFVWANAEELAANDALQQKLSAHPQAVVVLATQAEAALMAQRRALIALMQAGAHNPVVLHIAPQNGATDADVLLHASVQAGGLLLDGFGDGLLVEANGPAQSVNVAFNILQATRTRISKTEYIACPSCGRTLFDLQETTAKIRAVTSHLKGVKIGIMGCIVNGPGEMADADFGYVGSGPGKITLYRGKEVVQKNVPEGQAVDALIALIQQEGMWVEVAA
jgi:(E)-4-hydroxy-3-methylbut-2-enyl-diphosphate synthase